MLQHKVYLLRRNFLGRNNQITLVLTILIIHYYYKISSLEVLNGFLNGIQLYFFHISQY